MAKAPPAQSYPRYDLSEIGPTSGRKYIRFKLTVTTGPRNWMLFTGCIAGVGKDSTPWAMPSQDQDRRKQTVHWSPTLGETLAAALEKDGWFRKLLRLEPEASEEPLGSLSFCG